MISFNSLSVKFDLPEKRKIKAWLQSLATLENKGVGEIAFIFCSDDELLQINQQYLKHDYYTDVITFDYSENTDVSGDIFISVDTVRANAKKYNQSFDEELRRVMAHGVLHLCGYKDKTSAQKKTMREKEDFYLSKF